MKAICVKNHIDTELEGFIAVSALDLDGSVLAVDLIDVSGDHYLIADNIKGEHLLRHIGKRVSVFGRVSVEQSLRLFEVEKYRVL